MADTENEWEKGYNVGYADGYFSAMKATWKEQYEKLVQEISESERQRIKKMIEEYYNG